ncbi:dCMP deaminase family protein [Cognatishimia sp. 1_MG-2023]|uniref:deoxycytidylate deaminase n=1 Tax=Cognatishimia sp. 1_MG-2023 TaxID=3062642 RepID=UPI0026E36FCF|nr:dCMP deaminase family protein [Cognatishimia sp. 1_MG-2023]MDO6726060.1 dCMP deaminase family protein [Cognatishimia sp. 1_MG-2023]
MSDNLISQIPITLSQQTMWDQRFFELCDLISSWSEDESRKVGAVIVGKANEIRSTGYNGLPRGVSASDRNRQSHRDGEKYFWFEHAERNAIYNAARVGIPLDNCIIYSSVFPCADCARAIVQSGISELRSFPFPKNDKTYSKSFEVAASIFKETNLRIKLFER